MPDSTSKPAAAKPAEPTKTADTPRPASRSLAPAAESSDPAVQQLLAERQTAELNGDDDAVADVDKKLTKLGVDAT